MALGEAGPGFRRHAGEEDERREVLLAGYDAPRRNDARARLEDVLAELPERVQVYLGDLETLLSRKQVERGKDILAGQGTEVLIHPDGIEIRGDLRRALGVHFVGSPKGI